MTMTVEHFYRSSLVAGHPATDYLAVRGDTGAGLTGRYAVSVTENAYRGIWCEDCKKDECRHIDAVREARAAGAIPELDPITDAHWRLKDDAEKSI